MFVYDFSAKLVFRGSITHVSGEFYVPCCVLLNTIPKHLIDAERNVAAES